MKAVTIGSATIDIIASIKDNDIQRMTLHVQPVINTTIKGTAGAGDAFAATLAGCVCRGMDIAYAAAFAARNAASVDSALDAQTGLMMLSEFDHSAEQMVDDHSIITRAV